MTKQLPIVPFLGKIRHALTRGNLIVSAAPGAGKSTALLIDLVKHAATVNAKILVLQPRRVIARALANYLAEQLGESVGKRVGYRIRGESKVSSQTQLEIITEAILTRQLQADPELTGVGIIVFDEFHERSIHSDFGLALALEAQGGLREDLRLLIMSATLDMQSLQTLLPEAEHVVVEGRQFPIDYHYRPLQTNASQHRFKSHASPQSVLEQFTVQVTCEAMTEHTADILIFMPSVRAVNSLCEQLSQHIARHPEWSNVIALPLFGAQTRAEQQRAITLDPDKRRKIVVATNIAETSLTIEGIGIVIDSGLERRVEIDIRTGIEGLLTKQISQASAHQRAGRAGRLAAGHCYRLWSAETQARLTEQTPPEITQRDVSDLYLHALAWGTKLADLPLLTAPSAAQLNAAYQQLLWLKAIDKDGALTRHGQAILGYPTDIRTAHMLVTVSKEYAHVAAAVSVFLEGRAYAHNNDAISQFRFWWKSIDKASLNRITRLLQRRALHLQRDALDHVSEDQIALCLSLAHPDRIGFHLGHGKYKLANGKQAYLAEQDSVGQPQWLSIGGLRRADSGKILITLCQPIEQSALEQHLADEFGKQIKLLWHDEKQRFRRIEESNFGEIILKQAPLTLDPKTQIDDTEYQNAWAEVISRKGFGWLPLSDSAQRFMHRCRLAAKLCDAHGLEPFPELTELQLQESLAEWLLPHLQHCRNYDDLKRIDWLQILKNLLDWPQQQWLEKQLPTHYELPTGDNVKLDYSGILLEQDKVAKGPIAAARMPMLYGLQSTPLLADGKLPITFELLSPAQRPIQTTSDLGSFWQSESYQAIKKEMKGRYPKHLWPDDPANTLPTKRTKRSMQ